LAQIKQRADQTTEQMLRCGHTLLEQHPSTRTHNLQLHATLTTNYNQSYVPHAVNICIVSSSWWWA